MRFNGGVIALYVTSLIAPFALFFHYSFQCLQLLFAVSPNHSDLSVAVVVLGIASFVMSLFMTRAFLLYFHPFVYRFPTQNPNPWITAFIIYTAADFLTNCDTQLVFTVSALILTLISHLRIAFGVMKISFFEGFILSFGKLTVVFFIRARYLDAFLGFVVFVISLISRIVERA